MDIEALERQEIQKKQRLVAALFMLAIGLAMVFAYWMGAFGLGASRYLYVDYDFAGGLERGSTVRLAGIKVGRVSEISFRPQAEAEAVAQLRLKIEVNRDAFKQITEDSRFYINLAGLIGERYVEVVAGTGAMIKNAYIFRGSDPPRIDQLFSQGYGIFGDLRSFFQENKGDLKEMFNTLNQLSKNLSSVLANVSPQQKRELSALLSNLADASADLKSLIKNVNSGVNYVDQNGARATWGSFQKLLEKANNVQITDVRRLMLEDGVRVRFGKNEVPEEYKTTKGSASK